MSPNPDITSAKKLKIVSSEYINNVAIGDMSSHPLADRICEFISDYQNTANIDAFEFGGDGDDGEIIRAFLTAFFTQLDTEHIPTPTSKLTRDEALDRLRKIGVDVDFEHRTVDMEWWRLATEIITHANISPTIQCGTHAITCEYSFNGFTITETYLSGNSSPFEVTVKCIRNGPPVQSPSRNCGMPTALAAVVSHLIVPLDTDTISKTDIEVLHHLSNCTCSTAEIAPECTTDSLTKISTLTRTGALARILNVNMSDVEITLLVLACQLAIYEQSINYTIAV